MEVLSDNKIAIPSNMANYLNQRDNVILSLDFVPYATNGGYGHLLSAYITLKCVSRTCGRCGYNNVWKPELYDKCARHRYGEPQVNIIFAWSSRCKRKAEECFEDFLKNQTENLPPIKMIMT